MVQKINSVLESIETLSLGYTIIHEHSVTCYDWSLYMSLGSRYCETDRLIGMSVRKLIKAKAADITTVADGAPINLGIDIGMIKAAAEKSGINIIASTGLYH